MMERGIGQRVTKRYGEMSSKGMSDMEKWRRGKLETEKRVGMRNIKK